MRRLFDINKIDMPVAVPGARRDNPVFLCPVLSHRAFHPGGELAVARAAKAGQHLCMLATPSTTSIEELDAARGEPGWFQPYPRNDWNQTRQMIERAETSGCPTLVFTVDLPGAAFA